MTRMLLIAAFAGLAMARPETYREKEDFQFSRSSTDEGSKSGFYGAQRGNMGGNYEKAHNMDTLAQKQMSTAVNQVTGEIGASDANSGSVFTAANTRGVYGQGQFDLSNLQGRNFEETGTHNDDLQSSALHTGYGSHPSIHNSAYSGGHSAFKYSGFNADSESLHRNNLEALDQLSSGYREYGRQSGYGSEYRGYSGNQASAYDQQHSNLYAADRQYATKNRLVGASGTPVRLIIRPGSTVNVPVAAETIEDRQTIAASSHDSVNRDVEVLANPDRDHVFVRPTSGVKHYESSYKYNKEWEKHDTKPVSIPLAIPTIPQNKELYEEGQSTAGTEFQGNAIRNSAFQTAANSQSRYEANSQYNAQRHGSLYGVKNNAYTGSYRNNDGVDEVDSFNPAPKKYESSYSYHKSWERQGDPYVIKPVEAVPADSQRLTAATNQRAYGSHQYGSQYKSTHQSYTKSGALVDCDCDDGTHSRVVRSVDSVNQRSHDYNPYLQNYQQQEDLTQQLQNGHFENLRTQRNKWAGNSKHLEDLGQQTENQWRNQEHFGRNIQGKDEDLGQQTQDAWGNFESVNQGEFEKYYKHTNEHVKPVWEQSEDDTQVTQNTLMHAIDTTDHGSIFRPTIGNSDFPIHSPELGQTNHQNTYAHSMYKDSGFESHQHHNSEELMHDLTPEKLNKNQSTIQNLWDRIDQLQQTLKSNGEGMKNYEHSYGHGYEQNKFSLQNSMHNWDSDSGFMQNSYNNQNNFRWHHTEPEQVPSEELLPRASVKISEDVTSTTLKPFVNQHNNNPKEVGRGDIGDDDIANGVSERSQNLPTSQIYTPASNQQPKPYKTPEEIEALSLTKEQNETNKNINELGKFNESDTQSEIASSQSESSLGVISLSEQWLNELKKNLSEIDNSKHPRESHIEESTRDYRKNDNNESVDYTYHGSFDRHNTEHDQEFFDLVQEAIKHDQQTELGTFDQHSGGQFENIGQETVNPHALSESLNTFDTHNTWSHQNDSLGQEPVQLESLNSFDKEHLQQQEEKLPSDFMTSFHTQNTHSFHQRSFDLTENHGQETLSLYVPSETVNSFNHELQSHHRDFSGHETQNLNRPSDAMTSFDKPKNQYGSLSQQTVNLQTSSDFLNSFDPQSSMQHENMNQQSEDLRGFDQHNTDHKSEDLGQHSVDLQAQDKLNSFNKYVYDPSDKSRNLEQSADDTQYAKNFDSQSSIQQADDLRNNFYKEKYLASSSNAEVSRPNLSEEPQRNPEAEVVASVTEVTTEKPGFWKSVGSKFISAKDKVSSWFSNS